MSFVTLILLPSCEEMMGDFLEKAPGVDVTEDTIFSSQVQVETFVAGTYRYGIHSILPRNERNYTGLPRYTTTSIATDESESAVTWPGLQTWNVADVTPDNCSDNEDLRWTASALRFVAIRRANILLARIDQVNGLDPAYVSQVKGEAKFIRALNYFELLKRYGGVPIVDKKFELTDDFNVPRSTVKEVVDFIIKDCDDAIALLPDVYPSNYRGRATKGAALMMKSRTLLYAASPLFNTATPYLSMDDPANNTLICYGNYDGSRWQAAADAAKAVIDWAPSEGIALITNQGTDKNYKYIFEVNDNSEIILASKPSGTRTITQWPWTGLMPQRFYSGTWGMGYTMTLNFLKKYEKQDGTAQTWDPVGGTDLIQKYNELDLRFKQTCAIVGSNWNSDIALVSSYIKQDGKNAPHNDGNVCGQWITKHIPRTLRQSANSAMPNDIIFRLAEAYLNYAEALNEAQGPVPAAYAAVNIIRARSGQPDLPPGLNKEEFRERVRNERAIELFDEDHRLWDIRRWMIAEQDGVMQGNFYGLKIYENPAPPDFRYEVYKFETRLWNRRMYLHPFRRDEVLKGYLIQNPGY